MYAPPNSGLRRLHRERYEAWLRRQQQRDPQRALSHVDGHKRADGQAPVMQPDTVDTTTSTEQA